MHTRDSGHLRKTTTNFATPNTPVTWFTCPTAEPETRQRQELVKNKGNAHM